MILRAKRYNLSIVLSRDSSSGNEAKYPGTRRAGRRNRFFSPLKNGAKGFHADHPTNDP